jgi:hypothetical protein
MAHKRFLIHLSRNALISFVLIVGSLGVGIAGYRAFEKMSLLEAYLNAAMLLGGMGPVKVPCTPGGKLFAATYALYAGLVVVAVTAIMIEPVAHMVLRDFHSTRPS